MKKKRRFIFVIIILCQFLLGCSILKPKEEFTESIPEVRKIEDRDTEEQEENDKKEDPKSSEPLDFEKLEEMDYKQEESTTYPFFGTWYIDKVAFCSELYTGTELDGAYPEDIYDSADYIGYEIEYSSNSFRLGDSEYENPIYIIGNETVESVQSGGKFWPRLDMFLAEEEIKRNRSEEWHYDSMIQRIDVKFEKESHYRQYRFIPVGTQCFILNEDTMLVGVWGKILLAHKILDPENETMIVNEMVDIETVDVTRESNISQSMSEEREWEEEKREVDLEEKVEDDSFLEEENKAILEKKEFSRIKGNEFIIEKEYIDRDEPHDIRIIYPQLSGIYDAEKENKINSLIEEDSKKIMQEESLYRERSLYFFMTDRVKWMNENLISIYYKGFKGVNKYASYYSRGFITGTTIAVEEEKILTLTEVITDIDKLKEFLLEDKFEAITLWEGIATEYSLQRTVDTAMEGCFQEGLIDGIYKSGYEHMEWYIDGEQFVLVFNTDNYYYEYAIAIEAIQEILSEEFLRLLKVQ